MAWQLWWPGVYALAASVVLVALAFLVLIAGGTNRRSRWLATFLGFYGMAFFLSLGVAGLSTVPAVEYAAHQTGIVAVAVALVAYAGVLSGLNTPLAAPLRGGWLWWVLVVTAVISVVTVVVAPEFWTTGVSPVNASGGGHVEEPGPAMFPFVTVMVAMHLYAPFVAGHVVRTASSHGARRRARSFAIAFVGYDVLLLLVLGLYIMASRTAAGGTLVLLLDVLAVATAAAQVWLAAFLVYGTLTTQLFDIDVKIKVGISRTSVATVIAGAAFIGSELIEFAFGVDQLIPALAIAAGSAFALRPLAKLGDRLANQAMPNVEDTAEYRQQRARDVYEAALEDAAFDGTITDKERRMLDGLRRNLWLNDADANRLERRALGPLG